MFLQNGFANHQYHALTFLGERNIGWLCEEV